MACQANCSKASLINVTRLLVAVACCVVATVAATAQQSTGSFDHGMNLFREGRFEDAAKHLAFSAERKETPPEANLYLGKALINVGRFGEAEQSLKRFIALRAASDEAYYLLGFVLFRQGRARESLATYEQAVRLKPPVSDDLKIIGLNFGLLNDMVRSAEYLEKSLAHDPHNLEARYYLGRVRFTQNLFEEARASFEEVLRRDPRHIKAQNNLGQVYEAQNDQARAKAAYHRAIELDRSSMRPSELPLLNLAVLLSEDGELAEALALLVRAGEINPASAQVRFQLGKVYQRLGRFGEAEEAMLEATRLNPEDPGQRYVLGQLYRKLGKTELARQQLKISERLRGGKKL